MASNSIPYGERGYMIDRKGEVTPINEMYGHEAFVRKYSKDTLSVINFVADHGWILIQTINDFVEVTLCDETVTRQALSSCSKVLSTYHRGDIFSVSNYNREQDIDAPLLRHGTYKQVVSKFIQLKSGAETAFVSYLRHLEKASLQDKLEILEKKAKGLIWNKAYRVFHSAEYLTKRHPVGIKGGEDAWNILWGWIIKSDPTKNKQYLQWIVTKEIKNNGWNVKKASYWKEDLDSIKSQLQKYDDLKRTNKIPVEYKDINKFKTIDYLNDYIFHLEEKLELEQKGSIEEQEKAFFDKKEAEIFYESSSIRVIIPHSHEASCFFGRQTNWCTAIPKRVEYFADYTTEGPLYIIENKKGTKERFQFHFETMQFMDVHDKQINWLSLFRDKPFIRELQKAFDKIASLNDFTPLMKSPTDATYIYSVDSYISNNVSLYNLVKLAVNHPNKPLSKSGRYKFLTRWVRKLRPSSWVHTINTGAGEQSLAELFDIDRYDVLDKLPDIILKTTLSKDEVRTIFNMLLIKIRTNNEIVEKMNIKFKKKFKEDFDRPELYNRK